MTYDRAFGFYVHGVGFETAKFPTGWEKRCLRETIGKPEVTIVCPEIHDLAASKLAAGRPKDFDYVSVLIERDYVKTRTLLNRVARLNVPAEQRERMRLWIGAVAHRLSGRPAAGR